MTGVIIALLLPGFVAPQGAPTGLQTEQATNPTAVSDNLPDFRAVSHATGVGATRFQIQVSTDSTFATITHWNSPPPGALAIQFPGNIIVANNVMSPEIPYRLGALNPLALPYLDWNTTYFWHTRFGRVGGGTWSPFSATAQFTMAAPSSAINQHQNNGSPSADDWRFVSVPIAFGTTVPASQLLGSVSSLYQLDEPSRTWIPLGPTDTLEGGMGYLAWTSPSAVLSLTQGNVTPGIPAVLNGNGTTATPSYTLPNASFPSTKFSYTSLGSPVGQEITDGVGANGYAGNHLFGNPFYAPISWKDNTSGSAPFGHVSRTNMSGLMYKWNGSQYLTYNGITGAGTAGELIEPFQAVGIVVLNNSWQLTVNTPAPTSGGPQKALMASLAPAVPLPADPERWYLMIEARSGAAIDTENAFGIDPEADDAWDPRDSEEPGAGTATWVLVSFDHRSDWTTNPRKYTHDFRKTPTKAGDEVVWAFMVDGNTGLPATLTWPNLSSIPATDWKFTLEDPANSATVDLSSTSSYDTLPVNGPSTMTLRATRLKDSPAPPASNGGGGGGGSCGLLGPEGLLLIGWLRARRGARPRS